MSERVTLRTDGLKVLRTVDPLLMSYNIEMAEVTGGTFWKEYTPEQISGEEEFTVQRGSSDDMMKETTQVYPPVDLTKSRVRALAKSFGPAWVRISGTWSVRTYYDFEGTTNGVSPEGYNNVLTKEQWLGVLDFVKEVGGRLLIGVANCEGLHKANEPWHPEQAEKIFSLSKEYGVPIEAAEFMNEPNTLEEGGAPEGYTPEDFVRDQDIFTRWIRENYPEVLVVGPSTLTSEDSFGSMRSRDLTGVAGEKDCSTNQLMDGSVEPLDVFSYHYYNGISERYATIVPNAHWSPDQAHSEAYLDVAPSAAIAFAGYRDKYCPGKPMWVTESGDAGGGGNTWASTYLDVFRTLNELGSFATITDGVIFHNTLCASDYGFLRHSTFEPRPNYFAVLLWNRLMGTTVYDSGEATREGAHVYAHSRKDGEAGVSYLVINNSASETVIDLPKAASLYVLEGQHGALRASVMTLNGKPLTLGENDELPELEGANVASGEVRLPAGSCSFIVL